MDYLSLEEVKLRINKNYACISELETFIDLQSTEEEKLQLISLIGQMYSEYVTGVYASNTLEKRILEIGKNIHFSPKKSVQKSQILIVMSGAGYIGGHTLLVHNWIKRDRLNHYSIVFTAMSALNVPPFIKTVVEESGGSIFCLAGTDMEKAEKLLELSQDFEKVLLFTHMEDMIPVLAYGNKEWKTPVYFYNHADFRFSFGFSVSDVVLNLYEFDVDKTIRYRGIDKAKSVYMQFPVKKRGDKPTGDLDKQTVRNCIHKKYGIDNAKLVVSMGADFKYENIIGYEFNSFVAGLLEQSKEKINFLIIGANQDNTKWQQLEEKTQGRARALGQLPREEARELIAAADLYITSFPMMASGRDMAEMAGVPWLCLNIIGRVAVKDDIRNVSSVAELTERSLDVLSGNKKPYLENAGNDVWSGEKWLKEWKNICEKVNSHERKAFYPKRHIEKQEYVNCQLMQKLAPKAIYTYVMSHQMNPDVRSKLVLLDQKYEMGIFSHDKDCLAENYNSLIETADKYLQLYKTSMKWLGLKQEGRQIAAYLEAQGYHAVAIYGMGYMGECLAEELSNGSVIVQYGIDRNADQVYSGIKVYRPTDVLERVDVIINTTTVSNEIILKAMAVKDIKIMRLDELLDAMCCS